MMSDESLSATRKQKSSDSSHADDDQEIIIPSQDVLQSNPKVTSNMHLVEPGSRSNASPDINRNESGYQSTVPLFT